ncbi:MAG: diguanylate cyclase [Thauera sp.]|uniref:diguanylate cyclase n=1 Tax=Thauera sp. TaxID=1905334 RepID=UPI00260C74C9|nr:diguanylate cyclase [Thauera sp.]MCP5224332.1 diguanylate cyclase [Thauera sp.]
MDETELPCPFCKASNTRPIIDADGAWSARCEECGARGPIAADARAALSHWERVTGEKALLRMVIDESPDLILLKDGDGRFMLCNAALAHLYGTTPEQLVGNDDAALPGNTGRIGLGLESVRAVTYGDSVQIVEESALHAETGELRHFHSIRKPVLGLADEPCMLVIAHDITALKRAHRAIEERERSYAHAMEAAGEGIWNWDIEAGTLTHNRRWCELLGHAPDTFVHPIAAFSDSLHPDDRDEVLTRLDEALAGTGSYEHEHRLRRPDGSMVWVLDRGRVVERAPDGRPLHMAGTITDISARKHNEFVLSLATDALANANAKLERKVAERTADLARANEELARLARRDALTGLPNRLAVEERLHEETLRRPARRSSASAVLMIDIDFFKPINDTHGHATGDEVLAQVARLLAATVRESDFVGRYGGEEFLVLLPETTLEGARTVAEKLRDIVERTPHPAAGRMTISIGLAMAEKINGELAAVMAQADAALYEAKRTGRNRVVVASQSGTA